MRSAELAVEALVLTARPYASADDRNIFTDYEVALRQRIVEGRGEAPTAQVQSSTTLVFKTQGGAVVFGEFPFILSVSWCGRRVKLAPGDRVVLFGRYQKADAKWLFGPMDYFQVSDDTVLNWLPTNERAPEGLPTRIPLAEFTQRVRELAGKP